jgi:hypothetical protein
MSLVVRAENPDEILSWPLRDLVPVTSVLDALEINSNLHRITFEDSFPSLTCEHDANESEELSWGWLARKLVSKPLLRLGAVRSYPGPRTYQTWEIARGGDGQHLNSICVKEKA